MRPASSRSPAPLARETSACTPVSKPKSSAIRSEKVTLPIPMPAIAASPNRPTIARKAMPMALPMKKYAISGTARCAAPGCVSRIAGEASVMPRDRLLAAFGIEQNGDADHKRNDRPEFPRLCQQLHGHEVEIPDQADHPGRKPARAGNQLSI